MTQGAIQVDPVDAMVAELEQMVRSDCAQGLFWPSEQTRAARENVCRALRRAALPVAPSDERMLVDWKRETDDPLAEADAIYAEYSKTFGRYPDEFMAKTVEKVRHMLFDWWAWHRERIRAALLADAPLPVAALSDAEIEEAKELATLLENYQRYEGGMTEHEFNRCAALLRAYAGLLRHSEGKE